MNPKLFIRLFVAILAFTFFTNCSSSKPDVSKSIHVKVEINYGKGKAMREINVTGENSMTALEALLHAAKVETQPSGNFVFVTSIDKIKGEIGKMAWYYKVNSEDAKSLAIDNKLKDGDIVTWIYKKDVCSCKMDKCCKK